MKKQEHLQKIISQDRALSRLFAEFALKAGFILQYVTVPEKGSIWRANMGQSKQLDRLLKEFAQKYKSLIEAEMKKAWELAEEKSDSLLMDFLKGVGITIAGSQLLKWFNRISKDSDSVTIFNVLDLPRNWEAAEQFVKNRFKNGLSERVWNLAGENKQLIEMYLEEGLATGRSAGQISLDIRRFLKEPDKRFRRVRDPKTGKLKLSRPAQNYHPGQGVYRSSYQNALRVSRTETNMAYRMADITRWRKNEAILGYEVRLSGSHPREDICDFMAGRYPKTFTFTGWHPSCFCYSVPILMDNDDFVKYLKTDQVPQGLKVKGLPPQAGKYVRQHSDTIQKMKNRPLWVDNFKLKDGKFVPKQIIQKPPK